MSSPQKRYTPLLKQLSLPVFSSYWMQPLLLSLFCFLSLFVLSLFLFFFFFKVFLVVLQEEVALEEKQLKTDKQTEPVLYTSVCYSAKSHLTP